MTSGMAVFRISEGGTAARGGVRRGDIIVSIADVKTETVDDLHRTLSERAVGQPVDQVILRGQESMALKVTPVEAAQ